MKKFTQKEFDNFEINGFGYKICPTGDYTSIKKFGIGCVFGSYCRFGNGCEFGSYCRFGNGCIFGDDCEFGNGCVLLLTKM